MPTDVTRHTMPTSGKTFGEQARELLAKFPGVDHADLLNTVVALAMMDVRYGNKREERAACDLLNLVQAEAIKQLKSPAKSGNQNK